MIRENSQGNNQDKLAKASGQGFTPAPKSDRAPQPESSQLAPVSKNASQQQRTAKTFEEARDRKVDTAAKVATGGDRFVADVLEEAEQLADQKLAKKKAQLAEDLSEKMVEHRLTQAQETVDFFMLQWGSTDALLNPFRQAMAHDEEVETIEVQTA